MALARSGGVRRYYDINGWLFVGPALVMIGLFMLYPILWSLWMSSQSGRGTMIKFVGFGNVVRLANDPVFLHALSNTMIFFIVQVPIMILLALTLAAILNMPRLVGRGLFRTAIFLPCYRTRQRQQHIGSDRHHRLPDPMADRRILGQGPHHPRHYLAMDRLQHDLLSLRHAEYRQVDL
jgi:hypothetical protein